MLSFGLWFDVSVNSYGHVETVSLFKCRQILVSLVLYVLINTNQYFGKNYSPFVDFTRNYERASGIFVPDTFPKAVDETSVCIFIGLDKHNF